MIIVRDIMTTDLITVTPDMDISRAAKILFDNRINGAPVVDDNGSLVGILCQSDLITQQKKLPIPTIFTFLDGLIRLSRTGSRFAAAEHRHQRHHPNRAPTQCFGHVHLHKSCSRQVPMRRPGRTAAMLEAV